MAKNRLIGAYPVIGIRPTIDGRCAAVVSITDSAEGTADGRIHFYVTS